MKRISVIIFCIAAVVVSADAAYLAYDWSSGTVNTTIPDGNPAGITFSTPALSGDPAAITDVNVGLTISGGFNGDLYGYLLSPGGTRVQLFNSPGPGAAGNAGSSFSVTLSDDGVDGSIENVGASGNITGTYSADDSLNAGFGGGDANGTWRLFIADLSGGDSSQLISWNLQIEVVPEPTTWALVIFSALVATRILFKKWFSNEACREVAPMKGLGRGQG